MTPTRLKSLLIVATMLVVLALVSYFGTVASFERSVYTSAIDKVLSEPRTGISDPLPTFTSRPYRCEFADTYIDRPTDPILEVVNDANNQGTRPIPLMAASQLVPVMPWEDNLKIFKAGYIGLGDADLIFVSRVGFERFYGRAAVCLTRSISPHGWGVILILERSGLDWSVVSIEKSAIAI